MGRCLELRVSAGNYISPGLIQSNVYELCGELCTNLTREYLTLADYVVVKYLDFPSSNKTK